MYIYIHIYIYAISEVSLYIKKMKNVNIDMYKDLCVRYVHAKMKTYTMRK